MSNLITRRDAAEVVYKALRMPAPDYKKDPFHDSMSLAFAMAQQIPSAQQWIPVTERLPEEGEEGSDEVLVTCDNGRKHYFVTTGILLKGDWVNVVDNYYLPCEVVAWMPLPEPYHPEEGQE